MKKWMRDTIAVTCCSYTMMVLFFLVSSSEVAPDINRTTLGQTFLICFCCAVASQIISRLEFKGQWLQHILMYLTLILCIFGVGSFGLQLIPLTPIVVLSILFFTLCIYLVCWFFFFTINKSDADFINAQLASRRKEKQNDTHD